MKTFLCVLAIVVVYSVCGLLFPILAIVRKHEEILGVAKYAKSMLLDR